jgi:hypothetical protein
MASNRPASNSKSAASLNTSTRIGPIRIDVVCKLDNVKARLTEKDALDIFKMKYSGAVPRATEVAQFYGVTEKTIRDVWQGRTWAKKTRCLDLSRFLEVNQAVRKPHSKLSKTRRTLTSRQFVLPLQTQTHQGESIDDVLFDWDQTNSADIGISDPFHQDLLRWAGDVSPSNMNRTVDFGDGLA